MPNKTWIITGAVVVAAAIGYVALRGPQVPRKGTEGAIGAAKRYQSQQISNQDVTLDSPQVASFIQSDTFRKLATDKAFREAAKNEALASFLRSDQLREASAKTDVGKVLESAAVQKLLRDEVFSKQVESGLLTEAVSKAPELFASKDAARLEQLLSTPKLDNLVRKDEFRRLAEAWIQKIAVDDAARSIEKTDAAKRLAEFHQLSEQYMAHNSPEFKQFVANDYFRDALVKGVMYLFRTPALAEYSVGGLRETLKNPLFMEAVKTDGFIMVIEELKNPSDLAVAKDISSSADMLSILSDKLYRDAAMHEELTLVAKAGLVAAVEKVPTE